MTNKTTIALNYKHTVLHIWNVVITSLWFYYLIIIHVQIRTTITGTATQGTVTGLTPLTTYNCTIYAFNGLYGPRTDPITVTTTHPGIH